jgi:hypothetical protein
MPSLLEGTANKILKLHPKVALNRSGEVYQFDISNLTDELYPCPALSERGCTLPEEYKPFECSIWPFRVMNLDGQVVLGVCTDCTGLKDVPSQTVDDFANLHIRDIAMSYAEKYPQIVKPYTSGYRVIKD